MQNLMHHLTNCPDNAIVMLLPARKPPMNANSRGMQIPVDFELEERAEHAQSE